MARILVTGGAGFIGSHLVDAYLQQGNTVVVIDNLSTGKTEHLNPRAVFIEGDITNRRLVEKVFAQYGPFALVNHQAAQKSVTASVANPIDDAKNNILGSLAVFQLAKQFGVPKVVFASTGGALYGEGVPIPTPENAVIAPISPYGIAKYSTEHYLRFFSNQGMITQVLRYSNVYGPRQDPYGEAGVVAIFCSRLIKGKPLLIFGAGKQTRDFVYIDDVVAANLAASSAKRSGTWNIGRGQETSVNELVETLIAIARRFGIPSVKIEHGSPRFGELFRSSLAVAKAKRGLAWRAKTTLLDGLTKTFLSFYKQAGLASRRKLSYNPTRQ